MKTFQDKAFPDEPAEDEPVLMLRASDPHAAGAVLHYSRLINDYETGNDRATALNELADEMRAWNRDNAQP